MHSSRLSCLFINNLKNLNTCIYILEIVLNACCIVHVNVHAANIIINSTIDNESEIIICSRFIGVSEYDELNFI